MHMSKKLKDSLNLCNKKTKWNTLSQNENLFKKELNIFYIQQWKTRLPFLYNKENNDSFIKENKCKHRAILYKHCIFIEIVPPSI